MKLFLLSAILTLPIVAAELPSPSKLFRVSQVAFLASTAADVYSSQNLRETNPVLGRGDFRLQNQGAKSLAIAAGVTLLENFVVRRHPSMARVFKWVNFGMAGAHVGAAVSNFRLGGGR